MAAVLVFFRLPKCQTVRIMKKNNSGTLSVPAIGKLSIAKAKLISLLNCILPGDCQIKTSRDGYIVATIFFICITLFFYPAIVAAVWCGVKAGLHKEGASYE